MMDAAMTVEALGALAHEHRLAIYRLLVERGLSGLSAGAISKRLGVSPSSLTFHLQHLQRAQLVTQRRMGRQLIYAADFEAMNGLVGFLTENCCGRGLVACPPGANPERLSDDRNDLPQPRLRNVTQRPGDYP